MWFLVDASGNKVSDCFPSQAKLAVHMQMTPQTLQRAIKKGKNVFQFCGQEARVVQQTIPHFAVFDFSPSEGSNPIETFELASEVAKWLKVPNQTVYAAVKRGDETRIKKEGKVFWLKKLEKETTESEVKNAAVECSTPVFLPQSQPPVPLPRRKVPQPPVPLPRRKVPQPPPPVPLPRRKVPQPPPPVPPPQSPSQFSPEPCPVPVVTSSTPPEVVEVVNGGKTFPFETSKKLETTTFVSAEKVARFIKSGCGKMFLQGPKKHQMFICNNKRVHLPDLVKEIIVFHIRDQMWKDEDGAEAFIEKVMEHNDHCKNKKDLISAGFLARIRKLDDETIEQICKEFMKMV